MKQPFISLSDNQFREIICTYLQQQKALQICTDGTIKKLKCDHYFIDKKVVEEAIHGHVMFWYGRSEFVLVMNEEQGQLLEKNKLATYLSGIRIYGDVVLLKNYMMVNER